MLLVYGFATLYFLLLFWSVPLLLRKKVNCKTAPGRPFGRFPEEGVVITGDDSSMRVIVPGPSRGTRGGGEDSDIDYPGPVGLG